MRAGLTFDAALERATLPATDADRRLAHEIAAGALRTRRHLDERLEPLVDRGWAHTPDDTKDLLRIGAYQILELTRVPSYAAVQTTVDVAKAVGGEGTARLVNAVLRRVAETSDVGAQPGSLAARYSHPDWLVDRWVERWGAARTEALLAHNNTRPRLAIQPARWPHERLADALAAAGIAAEPAPHGHGLLVDGTTVATLPGYAEGAFVVQDPSQRHLIEAAGVPDGSVVWDACAAPGGKTVALAGRCRVLASDARQSRIPRLCDTLRRAAPGVPIFVADARRPPFARGSVDVVLLDVPCSATGTMARHPDARWRLTPERMTGLVRVQAALLEGAHDVVRHGGRLVYMTCSLEPEENEGQVEGFLTDHPDFARAQPDVVVFPADAGADGGFVSALERQ